MVDRLKVEAAVKSGVRRGLTAGALLVGMSIVASCSMFGEDSSDQPAAAAGEQSGAPAESRAVGPVSEGLIGDSGNARYDESIGRRPVTTVRPLEDAPAEAEAPAPVPRQESAVQTEPVAPVAAAPEPAPLVPEAVAAAPAPAVEPAPAPEPARQAAAPARPSGTSPVIAESTPAPAPAPASLAPEPLAPVAEAAPVPPAAPLVAQPTLVADTSRLDAAAAAAYGGRAPAPRVQPLVPSAVVSTPVGGGFGGYASAAGPVVIGGPVAQPAMRPAVVGQGGTVVVGGAAPAVVVGGPYGGAAAAPAYGAPAGEPVAVIHFEFGSAGLSARDRQVIAQVADLQARQGGFVRIVGHSSRFTANMPQERHMLVNLETSAERAETVARALVREGVPTEVVETTALGASQPMYEEVMPAGLVGNQRVEIYLVR